MCVFTTPNFFTTVADCSDVDECAVGRDSCSHKCTNVEGGYTCSCETGYILSENIFNCSGQQKSAD